MLNNNILWGLCSEAPVNTNRSAVLQLSTLGIIMSGPRISICTPARTTATVSCGPQKIVGEPCSVAPALINTSRRRSANNWRAVSPRRSDMLPTSQRKRPMTPIVSSSLNKRTNRGLRFLGQLHGEKRSQVGQCWKRLCNRLRCAL